MNPFSKEYQLRGKVKKTPHRIKPGKKTKMWDSVKPGLKEDYQVAGITYCEIGAYLMDIPQYADQVSQHRHQFFLTWAHGKKRRKLKEEELKLLLVLGCFDCHTFIEALPHAEMLKIIQAIIRARPQQP